MRKLSDPGLELLQILDAATEPLTHDQVRDGKRVHESPTSTLLALRRLGLIDSDGPVQSSTDFFSLRWTITPRGREALQQGAA